MQFKSAILFGFLTAALLGARFVIGAQESEQSRAEQYIKSSESQWAEAEVNRDYKVAERILADDFVGVAPDGSHYSKAQEVARTRTAKPEFSSNKTAEIAVRFFGDAAVAQGSENWKKLDGHEGSYVWTDTWIRRNGSWQVVAAEDIEVPRTK